MKYINKIGVMLSASFMLAAASCTDYSDYNTVPESQTDGSLSAGNTLWQNIEADQQLTKLAAIARQSNFQNVLNSARFYTLWAPVDDAFSDEEYNSLMASDSATIVDKFFYQHMAEYNHPISAALDSTNVISINRKHHPFTQLSFDDITYQDINQPASNGVMHKLNGVSTFFNNLYENFDAMEGCDQIKAYIQKNDLYILDPNASVIGPLRDGQQTYLDSVMKKTNNVIRQIMRADLENEDSTYCMVIPNDDAWTAAYEAINPHYNYIAKLDYMDLNKKGVVQATSIPVTKPESYKSDTPATATSDLQDSLTCRNIVSNLVFSNSSPYNQKLFVEGSFEDTDSAYSTNRNFLTGMQEVMNHTLAVSEMSNGMTRTVDSLTFKSWQTYNPVLVYGKPEYTLNVKKVSTHNVPLTDLVGRDSLFSKVPEFFNEWLFPEDSRFFTYYAVDSANIAGSNSAKPEFDFPLRGVRSSSYHIYVITVPEQVEFPEAAERPYYLRFYLSYTDADNKQYYKVMPMDKNATTKTEMTTADGDDTSTIYYLGDPGRVNVFDLGEVTFPACYYGLDAYPSLMMAHTKSYTSTSNRKKYDRQMRVAGVFLVPTEYNDLVNPQSENE